MRGEPSYERWLDPAGRTHVVQDGGFATFCHQPTTRYRAGQREELHFLEKFGVDDEVAVDCEECSVWLEEDRQGHAWEGDRL